jgi:teichuronic acid biosynthesis glycosyltransferase TuaC
MKILFVYSANSKKGISPIVKAQANSIIKQGVEVFFYGIVGKGLRGYLSNIYPFRKIVKGVNPDIIHAHYSLSAIMASFVKSKPLVVSLMGSDVKSSKSFKRIIRFFEKLFWDLTIVKSEDMKQTFNNNKLKVVPNGVDISVFKPLNKTICQNELHWDNTKTHILFAANPNRPEKQYQLAKKSVESIANENIILHTLIDVEHSVIPVYMNASDIVLLTSKWEGSPNVIKEAMACNKTIVATDVGDIKWLFGVEEGFYLCKNNFEDITRNLKLTLDFLRTSTVTQGRERIIELELDSDSVAKKLITVYNEVIQRK